MLRFWYVCPEQFVRVHPNAFNFPSKWASHNPPEQLKPYSGRANRHTNAPSPGTLAAARTIAGDQISRSMWP